jgi:hypothetical protein
MVRALRVCVQPVVPVSWEPPMRVPPGELQVQGLSMWALLSRWLAEKPGSIGTWAGAAFRYF